MGFKKSSDIITVSGRVEETAANTFTEGEINLSLDALNNEIFVILSVDTALAAPDGIAATDTSTLFQLTATSQTAITGLENNNVIVRSERLSQGAGFVDNANTWEHMAGETPDANLDYIAIVATPDMFAQIEGVNNGNPKACAFRIWGYSARADSATYAALVQSSVLSS